MCAGDCQIGDDGAVALGESLRVNKSLEDQNLSYCNIGARTRRESDKTKRPRGGVERVTPASEEAIRCQPKSESLSGTVARKPHVVSRKGMARSVRSERKRLKRLTRPFIQLGNAVLTPFAHDLAANNLDAEAGKTLASMLEVNAKLKKYISPETPLGTRARSHLAKASKPTSNKSP